MNKLLILIATSFLGISLHGQVGIGTENPDPSSALDITSSDKGLLIPRVLDTAAVNMPATGLMIYTTSGNQFFFYNGSKWQLLGSVVQSELSDADNDTKVYVEKNPDEDIIRMDIRGQEKFVVESDTTGRTRIRMPNNLNNIAMGVRALEDNTSGSSNVAIGPNALQKNTSGYLNLAYGALALNQNTSGFNNVATGYGALQYNTTGNHNVGIGYLSLYSNLTGSRNVAIGRFAGFYETGSNKLYIENTFSDSTGALIYGEFDKDSLRLNAAVNINGNYILPTSSAEQGQTIMSNGSNELIWGNNNVLADADSDTKISVEKNPDEDIIRMDIRGQEKLVLESDSIGRTRIRLSNNLENLAIGRNTIKNNTSGEFNMAIGDFALNKNTAGFENIAIGRASLEKNTTGNQNIAFGSGALKENTTGNSNVATGKAALQQNVAGSRNVAIGYYAGSNEMGSHKLYIENTGADSTGALIYGEFDKDSLRFNAAVNINGNYILPTISGSQGQVIMSDGSKELVWGSGNSITDADNDTKIQVEKFADEDIIRMDLNGQERFQFITTAFGRSRMAWPNNQGNIALGNSALNFNTTGIDNVAIGQFAFQQNTTGSGNVAIGPYALVENLGGSSNTGVGQATLEKNTSGMRNVATGAFAMRNNTTGIENISSGYEALFSNTTGSGNVANGFRALYSNTIGSNNVANGLDAMRSNTSGMHNVATGTFAMRNNTTGIDNVSGGHEALYSNTTGSGNVANGFRALYSNNGNNNTAIGYQALFSNTLGTNNVANGLNAMQSNTTGYSNVAIGPWSLNKNIGGHSNAAIGVSSMQKNTDGVYNVALGAFALEENLIGDQNTAIGAEALESNTIGVDNVAAGYRALEDNIGGTGNTAIGKNALKENTSGYDNVAIGNDALGTNLTGYGNIGIGFNAGKYETGNNKLYIHNSGTGGPQNALIYGDFDHKFISISDQLTIGGLLPDNLFYPNVTLGVQGKANHNYLAQFRSASTTLRLELRDNGNLWISGTLTENSDIRLKKQIKPLESSLDGLLQLGGYNYFWKDSTSSKSLQTGVIAQEVLEVFPELVNEQEDHYSVNYSGLIPHLIEGMKEQQTMIEKQEGIIKQQEKEMKQIKEDLKELKNLVNALSVPQSEE